MDDEDTYNMHRCQCAICEKLFAEDLKKAREAGIREGWKAAETKETFFAVMCGADPVTVDDYLRNKNK